MHHPPSRFVALSRNTQQSTAHTGRTSLPKARPGPNSRSHQPIRHLISGLLPFWAIRVSSNIVGSGALSRGNSPRFPSSRPPTTPPPWSQGSAAKKERERKTENIHIVRLLIVCCLHPSICTPRSWIGDPVTPHRTRIILQCIDCLTRHLRPASKLLIIHLSTRLPICQATCLSRPTIIDQQG